MREERNTALARDAQNMTGGGQADGRTGGQPSDQQQVGRREDETASASPESGAGTGEALLAGQVQRRTLLGLLAAAPLSQFAITLDGVERAARRADDALRNVAERRTQFRPKFFTPDELLLARVLANVIIPKDERSGSATDAAVPEFMDFIMIAYPDMQKWMRDGLKWMNAHSVTRCNRAFADCAAADQVKILDEIAYPKRAAASVRSGAEFFSRFRDLTASGFWSSKIGAADLQYMGNRVLSSWNGCPPAALAKLGVRY